MTTCTQCGKENERHYKFCLGCGSELPSSATMPTPTTRGWLDEDPGAAPAPAAAAVADHSSVPGEAAAHDTAPSASPRACPTCGMVVPVAFTFCGQCGARMDAPAITLRDIATTGISQGQLTLIRADGTEGGTHSLQLGDNLIGRGHGPLFDADGYLSPRHAQLRLDSTGALVTDTDSLNGVFLRLTEEEEIYDGDLFRVGQELLRFDLLPPAEPLDDGTHIMGSPPGNAWGRLVLIVARDQDGSAFPVSGDSVVLGRERGDILFPEDGYVSGTHARLSLRNGRHYLADLNSSNGSFLRLRGARQVPSGGLLLMGQQLFRVAYS